MRNPRHVAPVYRGTLTDQKLTPKCEFAEAKELPVVLLECCYQPPRLPDYPSIKEEDDAMWDEDVAFQEAVVELNGEFYYLETSDWYTVNRNGKDRPARFLVKQLMAMDSGDNIVRTRTAPDTRMGITKPKIGHYDLNAISSEPVYVAFIQ